MKGRIDKLLVDLGYFDSRERAQKNIMAGRVLVNDFIVDKPGFNISSKDNIVIKEDAIPYVSRGGMKLKKSIDKWDISLEDKVCMDIGASTGGFTDVMLKNGAKTVYSVDVGYGQLDWKLRQDPRVVNLERTNIRYLDPRSLDEKINFFSIDVSFISLKLVFPKLKGLGADHFECVALIKPQFEVGRDEVGKKGVVRDKRSHIKAIHLALRYATEEGLYVKAIDYSPIKGPKGNIEFLMYLSNGDEISFDNELIQDVVQKAHEELNSISLR
ncbi:MAG: TlyA family RNA methyltransferase [Peptostreptococcaceae bacterium]|nr:TlyA family RNA methyltransferase [Peptostreptococcaceae bacterium]